MTLSEVINNLSRQEFFQKYVVRIGQQPQFSAFLSDPEGSSFLEKTVLRNMLTYAGISPELIESDEDLLEACKLIMSRAVKLA